MINLKNLRKYLEEYPDWNESTKISMQRKKKMVLVENTRGNCKSVRKNIIKIEIVE